MADTKAINFKGVGGLGLLLGLIGMVGVGIYFFTGDTAAAKATLQSYLFGWYFMTAVVLGCFGLMLLQNVVRSSWGVPVLRIFEAGGGPAALFTSAISFIPILMNLDKVYYKWMKPAEGDLLVLHKTQPIHVFGTKLPGYLTPEFFTFRFILVFAIWITIAYFLTKWSKKEDETKDPGYRRMRVNLGAYGMVTYVVTVSLFASTDWFMSLDPHWFSTMYGPLFFIGGCLFAMAMATAIVCANAWKDPYRQVVSPNVTRDLGNLCFAICMLWIYFTLSQYIIIWNGNLPEFTIYYKLRQEDMLSWIGFVNIVGGWLIPWMLLLSPPMKAKPQRLLFVCCWLLCLRFVDVFWNVVPFFGRTAPIVTDALAILGLGGIWLAVAVASFQKKATLPQYDTRLQEALHHSHA